MSRTLKHDTEYSVEDLAIALSNCDSKDWEELNPSRDWTPIVDTLTICAEPFKLVDKRETTMCGDVPAVRCFYVNEYDEYEEEEVLVVDMERIPDEMIISALLLNGELSLDSLDI